MSKPLRVTLVVFGLLLTLYVALIGVLSTEWFHRLLVQQAKARLEALTGARVEVGAMILRPTVLEVTFKGLVLHGRESASEPALLSAGVVVVRMNPFGLLRSRVLVRTLDCDGAEIHLRTYAGGSTNLPGPLRPYKVGHGVDDLIDLALRRATVTHTNLYWNNLRIPLDLSAKDVAILVTLNPATRRLLPWHALKIVSSALTSGDRYVVSISSSELICRVPGWTLPPLTLAAQLDFARNDLALRSLTWRSSGLQGQASLSLYRLPSLNAQLALKAEGEVAEWAKVLGFPKVKGGNFAWDAQATYQSARRQSFEARGRLQVRQLRVVDSAFELGDINLSTDYSADRRRVELSNLRVNVLGGAAEGRAEALLQGPLPKFVVRAQLHRLSLAQLLESFSGARDITDKLYLDASIDGTSDVTWVGKLKHLTSSFDLSFEPRSGLPGSRSVIGYARGTAEVAPGLRLSLQDAELQTPHGLLRAQGTLAASAFNLNVLLTTRNFEEWRPLAEAWARAGEPIPLVLKSSATFSGSVVGSRDQPQVRGRLAMGAFDFRDWGWGSLQANVSISPQILQVNSGRLVHQDSALTFNIGLGLDHGLFTPSSLVHIIAEAQRTPLAGLGDALEVHYPMEGSTTGHLDLSGSRTNLTGAGAIQVEHGQIDGESFDSLAAKFRVVASVWEIQDIHLAKGSARINGKARLEPSRHFLSTELHGRDLPLSDLRRLPFHRMADAKSADSLEGRTDFDLRGEGTLQNPQLQLRFDLHDITSNGSVVGRLGGQLSWQGARLQVKGDFGGPDGVLSFDGSAQTENDWPIQLSGRYEGLRVDPWANWVEPGALKVAVTGSGSLRLTGPLKDAGRLELQTEADNLEISVPPLPGSGGMVWKNQGPVRLSYARRVLTASRFRLRGPSTDLQVEGSLRFAERPILAANIQGHADAAIVRLVDPHMRSVGSFDVSLKASGTPSKPRLSGTVTVNDLSIAYPGLPFRASELNGEVRLEGDRAVVSLREKSGQGLRSFAGYVTVIGPTRFDLRVDLDHERLAYPVEVTSVLDGHLHLVGTPDNAQLLGEIVVEHADVAPDFNLLAWMDRLQAPRPALEAGTAAPFASTVLLNVAVASRPYVRIESRTLRVTATIDLRLHGPIADPVALGTIRVLSGDTVIRGNRYEVTRGDIILSNPARTSPVLDIEAQTRIQRYVLTITMSGPLERAKLSYRSDPPLRTEEVLSLLALGYAPSEQQMTVGGSAGANIGAASLLSEALSSGFTGRVQRLFGVSRIRVDPSEYETTSTAGYRVTVEQQLARDFTVTYVLNTVIAGHDIVRLEWTAGENVSVIAERDINGVYGMELRFRRRFK
jgi:translocation and assembly module TamB